MAFHNEVYFCCLSGSKDISKISAYLSGNFAVDKNLKICLNKRGCLKPSFFLGSSNLLRQPKNKKGGKMPIKNEKRKRKIKNNRKRRKYE